MPVLVNIGGVYRNSQTQYAKISGVWRTCAPPKVNINGVWRPTQTTSAATNLAELGYTVTDPENASIVSAGTGVKIDLLCSLTSDSTQQKNNNLVFDSFDYSPWKYLTITGAAQVYSSVSTASPSGNGVGAAVLINDSVYLGTPSGWVGWTQKSLSAEKNSLADLGLSGIGTLTFSTYAGSSGNAVCTAKWALTSVVLSN